MIHRVVLFLALFVAFSTAKILERKEDPAEELTNTAGKAASYKGWWNYGWRGWRNHLEPKTLNIKSVQNLVIQKYINQPQRGNAACGRCGDRKQTGKAVRSAFRAAEFIRDSMKNDTIGHARAAAYLSLRLVGYEITSADVSALANVITSLGLANITTGQIAYYVMGIVSSCRDPSDFFGNNLINPLIQGVQNYPIPGSFDNQFSYALAVLALCITNNLAAVNVNYNLLSNASLVGGVDTKGMGLIALSCIYKRLKDAGNNPVALAQVGSLVTKGGAEMQLLQASDGSFGNSISTAKAVQALLSSDFQFASWDCAKAIEFMISKQKTSGSFLDLLFATVQVMPALIGAVPHDVIDIPCIGQPIVYPRVPINVCVRINFLTSPPSGQPTPPDPPQQTVTVLNGTVAYDILLLAANQHNCYQFTTEMTAFGRSITSICGVPVDAVNKKYWIMYQDQNTWAPAGIDRFMPEGGSCVIFKYQTV